MALKKLGIPTILGQAFDNAIDAVNTDTGVISAGAVPSNAVPIVDGVGAAGTSPNFSRADHVHPTDSSRAADASVVHTSGNESIAGNKTFSGKVMIPTATPAGATAAGTVGQLVFDSGFLYVCTGATSWLRFAPDSTWS